MNSMKRKRFVSMLESDGWILLREGSNHTIYAKEGEHFHVGYHLDVKAVLVSKYFRKHKKDH